MLVGCLCTRGIGLGTREFGLSECHVLDARATLMFFVVVVELRSPQDPRDGTNDCGTMLIIAGGGSFLSVRSVCIHPNPTAR